MSCEAPRRAYKPADGGRLKFYKVTDKEYYQEPYTGLQVPCGLCILCREEQARQNAVRITHEQDSHLENSWLTLTYDEQHLPLDHGTPTLYYRHTITWLKRLRIELHRKMDKKISFYLVGEYGEKTGRPHYHVCIFGHAFTEERIWIRQGDQPLWTNPLLMKTWTHGQAAAGALTYETARYTASYVTKKLRAKQQYVRIDEQTGELLPLTQPRAFSSRNPAIGRTWWEKWHQGLIDHDYVVINGRTQKPPKYYDRLLEQKDKSAIEKIKTRRNERKTPETAAETRARAESARARAKQQKKSV